MREKKAQRLFDIASLTNQTFTNFVSGQLTEAVIIGVLCFFGMLILGIPYAGAVSAFVAVYNGLTALLPIFGAWIGGGETFGIATFVNIGFYRIPICWLPNLRCVVFKIKPKIALFALLKIRAADPLRSSTYMRRF